MQGSPNTGRRRRSLWISSLLLLALALGLLILALKIADVDLGDAWARMRKVEAASLASMLALALVQTWLGSEKWRLVQSAQGESPGHAAAFSLSAIGVGLGQILPSQIAASVARALGAKWLGSGSAVRGGLASLYEQGFDVLIVACLAGSTALAIVFPDRAWLWLLSASSGLATGLAVTMWVAGRLNGLGDSGAQAVGPRWLARLLARMAAEGYVSPALVFRLFLLSVARFAMVGLVCIAMSEALAFDIPYWKIVAALPLPLIALAVASTPGGIGVNELAMSSGLMLLGVPAETALQWALASRALSAAIYLSIGAIGFMTLAPQFILRANRPRA